LKVTDGVKLLTAIVNGVAGTFLVDSGATYLTVTTAFSDKAKLNLNAAVRIPMKTVGGTVQATMGTASAVVVGNAEARSVTVAVIQDSREPFGARIDGLLGMSFLTHFDKDKSPSGCQQPARGCRPGTFLITASRQLACAYAPASRGIGEEPAHGESRGHIRGHHPAPGVPGGEGSGPCPHPCCFGAKAAHSPLAWY
jgi:clan AA aspartic protease (TIGR02281 family)